MTSDEQTKTLDKLRERLQSIAILAVQAQDRLANPDAVDDLIYDIQQDLVYAQKFNDQLR